MDDDTLNQAIELSKAGRNNDARKLLRPLLEVEPENEMAWLWFANSFDTPEERIKALKNCLAYCPGSQLAADGVQALEEQMLTASPVVDQKLESLAVDLRNDGVAMFTELDADDGDNSPFTNDVIDAGKSVPLNDRLDQVNFAGTTKPPISLGKSQTGLGEFPGNIGSPKPVIVEQAVSPFVPSIPERISGKDLNGPTVFGEEQKMDSGSAYRIPFIIVSITGSLLLIVFAIIMIVLFLGR